MSRLNIFSAAVGFVIDVIRNLPLLLILFFTYFALPDIGIRLNVIVAAIVAMSIFESAMLAEIVRSGINAVPRGQMEAARSNGLTFYQAMRYIIMPQALKKMIPPIVSQFISLVKDTSLATIILLPEATYHAQIIYGQNINYMIPTACGIGRDVFCCELRVIFGKSVVGSAVGTVELNDSRYQMSLIAIKIGPRQTNFVWSGPICFSYFAKSSGKEAYRR